MSLFDQPDFLHNPKEPLSEQERARGFTAATRVTDPTSARSSRPRLKAVSASTIPAIVLSIAVQFAAVSAFDNSAQAAEPDEPFHADVELTDGYDPPAFSEGAEITDPDPHEWPSLASLLESRPVPSELEDLFSSIVEARRDEDELTDDEIRIWAERLSDDVKHATD